MRIDHVALVVPDAEAYGVRLRREHGFGSNGSVHLPHIGARSWAVPVDPPSYVELLQVTEPDVANASDLGRRLLALAEAGGLVAWCVMVSDIAEVARRTGIAVYEGRSVGARSIPWYTVTGPDHLPFFIAYDDPDGVRAARWQARYDEVRHDNPPTRFARLDVAGDPAEYDAWLGPHDLPLRFVDGEPGLHAAVVDSARGEVVIR
jgi:hypothetical protein